MMLLTVLLCITWATCLVICVALYREWSIELIFNSCRSVSLSWSGKGLLVWYAVRKHSFRFLHRWFSRRLRHIPNELFFLLFWCCHSLNVLPWTKHVYFSRLKDSSLFSWRHPWISRDIDVTLCWHQWSSHCYWICAMLTIGQNCNFQFQIFSSHEHNYWPRFFFMYPDIRLFPWA